MKMENSKLTDDQKKIYEDVRNQLSIAFPSEQQEALEVASENGNTFRIECILDVIEKDMLYRLQQEMRKRGWTPCILGVWVGSIPGSVDIFSIEKSNSHIPMAHLEYITSTKTLKFDGQEIEWTK